MGFAQRATVHFAFSTAGSSVQLLEYLAVLVPFSLIFELCYRFISMLSVVASLDQADKSSNSMLEEFDCDFDFLDLHGSELHTRQSGER